MALTTHPERHRTDRIGWLRAAVLGANDGIVSTASLVLGVAAAGASQHNIIVTGVAGLVAGAMSMAAGEYVSVHSQSDTEQADLSRERAELQSDGAAERRELTAIYVPRGLQPALAQQVAEQLMAHDALGAHARDELGISAAMLENILPVSARAQGLRSDTAAGKHLTPSPLASIRLPTLVISARDDRYGTYASAQYTAANIPGAKFIGFDAGGHTWVGHDDEVMSEIVKLLVSPTRP